MARLILPPPSPVYDVRDQVEIRRLTTLAVEAVAAMVSVESSAPSGGTLLITGGSAGSTFSGGVSTITGGSA